MLKCVKNNIIQSMMCIGCVADIWESVLNMKIYENSNLIVVLINKSYLATYFCYIVIVIL